MPRKESFEPLFKSGQWVRCIASRHYARMLGVKRGGQYKVIGDEYYDNVRRYQHNGISTPLFGSRTCIYGGSGSSRMEREYFVDVKDSWGEIVSIPSYLMVPSHAPGRDDEFNDDLEKAVEAVIIRPIRIAGRIIKICYDELRKRLR